MNPRRWLLAATGVAALLAAHPAVAQPYPSRPISMIVPASAGGPTDATGRVLAERMGAVLGQTVLIDNVAGEVPTVDEAGLPGLYVSVWHGLWAPKGTPAEITARLNGAAVKALGEPATKEKLAALGPDIPPVEQLTPQALAAFQKAEIDKWWPIVKAAGIKAE